MAAASGTFACSRKSMQHMLGVVADVVRHCTVCRQVGHLY